jgi:hypothetical protein
LICVQMGYDHEEATIDRWDRVTTIEACHARQWFWLDCI